MGVVIAPPELNVDPVLALRGSVVVIPDLMEERGLGDRPLEGREEENVCAGGVHFVGLPGVDRFFLNGFNAETLHLHIQYLADVHDNRLVNFLPQVRSENLDQRYF